MIHYVISEVDRGEPIILREIECRTPETLDELKERVHSQEHELILEGTHMAISRLWEERQGDKKWYLLLLLHYFHPSPANCS